MSNDRLSSGNITDVPISICMGYLLLCPVTDDYSLQSEEIISAYQRFRIEEGAADLPGGLAPILKSTGL